MDQRVKPSTGEEVNMTMRHHRMFMNKGEGGLDFNPIPLVSYIVSEQMLLLQEPNKKGKKLSTCPVLITYCNYHSAVMPRQVFIELHK